MCAAGDFAIPSDEVRCQSVSGVAAATRPAFSAATFFRAQLNSPLKPSPDPTHVCLSYVTEQTGVESSMIGVFFFFVCVFFSVVRNKSNLSSAMNLMNTANMQINFSGETIKAVDLKPDYDPYRVRLNLALPVFRLNT